MSWQDDLQVIERVAHLLGARCSSRAALQPSPLPGSPQRSRAALLRAARARGQGVAQGSARLVQNMYTPCPECVMVVISQPSAPSLFRVDTLSSSGSSTFTHLYSHRVGEVPARTGGTTSCAATPPVAQPTTKTMAMIALCFMAADSSRASRRRGHPEVKA